MTLSDNLIEHVAAVCSSITNEQSWPEWSSSAHRLRVPLSDDDLENCDPQKVVDATKALTRLLGSLSKDGAVALVATRHVESEDGYSMSDATSWLRAGLCELNWSAFDMGVIGNSGSMTAVLPSDAEYGKEHAVIACGHVDRRFVESVVAPVAFSEIGPVEVESPDWIMRLCMLDSGALVEIFDDRSVNVMASSADTVAQLSSGE